MRNSLSTLGHDVRDYNNDIASLEKAIKFYAPQVLTTAPAEHVSDKYTFLNTMEVIKSMMGLGWEVTHVNGRGRGEHGLHMVRMFHNELGNKVQQSDAMRPQLVLFNSHDGTNRAKMALGMFRLVCSNGLIVGEPGMYDDVKLKHIYNSQEDFINITQQAHNKYEQIFEHIYNMRERILSDDERKALAYYAIALREKNLVIEGTKRPDIETINNVIDVKEVLKPLRIQDKSNSLWDTMNVIEERLTKGKFYKYDDKKGYTKAKALTEIKRNHEFHEKLNEVSNAFMENTIIL